MIDNSQTAPAESDLEQTRARILDAAEQVFADIGFEPTTIRAICVRAGVKNIAAVSYYFGSKENLYAETVRNALLCCSEGLPFPDWPPVTSPVQKLRDFIRVMMSRFLRAPRVSAMKLMMREFAQPSPACRDAVMQHIHPMAQLLHSVLNELLPDAPAEQRWLIGFSIVGQCIYYRQNRAVGEILMGDAFGQLDVDRLSDHVANFTLAALGMAPPIARADS